MAECLLLRADFHILQMASCICFIGNLAFVSLDILHLFHYRHLIYIAGDISHSIKCLYSMFVALHDSSDNCIKMKKKNRIDDFKALSCMSHHFL